MNRIGTIETVVVDDREHTGRVAYVRANGDAVIEVRGKLACGPAPDIRASFADSIRQGSAILAERCAP